MHAAAHYNTVQHAAAHYNTLQHTATHSCTALASFFFENETSSRDVSLYTKRDARQTFERMLHLLLQYGLRLLECGTRCCEDVSGCAVPPHNARRGVVMHTEELSKVGDDDS